MCHILEVLCIHKISIVFLHDLIPFTTRVSISQIYVYQIKPSLKIFRFTFLFPVTNTFSQSPRNFETLTLYGLCLTEDPITSTKSTPVVPPRNRDFLFSSLSHPPTSRESCTLESYLLSVPLVSTFCHRPS